MGLVHGPGTRNRPDFVSFEQRKLSYISPRYFILHYVVEHSRIRCADSDQELNLHINAIAAALAQFTPLLSNLDFLLA